MYSLSTLNAMADTALDLASAEHDGLLARKKLAKAEGIVARVQTKVSA